MEFIQSNYLWILSFHVISVISWMAGIFYLPRLFVNHAERARAGSETSEIFKIMELKLYKLIMRPAMIATWVSGLLMVVSGMVKFISIWFFIKFLCVVLMTVFHFWCGKVIKLFAKDQNTCNGRIYRIANEVPTVLVIVIVFMVILKPFS